MIRSYVLDKDMGIHYNAINNVYFDSYKGVQVEDRGPSTDWRGLRGWIGGWFLCSPLRRAAEIFFLGDLDSSYLREIGGRCPDGDETVLDLGAGSGYFSLKIARKLVGGKVVCVDLSEEMLGILRGRAKRKGLENKIEVVRAHAASTGLEDESCDLAVSSGLFHELSRPNEALAEMVRVVKPGGSVVVADFRDMRMPHGEGAHGPFSVNELTELFHEGGLIDTHVYPVRRWVVGVGRKFSSAA